MMEAMDEANPVPELRPTCGELFMSFLAIGLQGFGGVLPWARRMLVEQRGWLTEAEFIEVLSLAQFLPGPNIVNVSIIVGRRFSGVAGATSASIGLMFMPFLIVLALAALYARYAGISAVRGATDGVSAAATGLIIAMAVKMSYPLRHSPWMIGVGVATFLVIALARVPLLWVLAVMAPISVGIAWFKR